MKILGGLLFTLSFILLIALGFGVAFTIVGWCVAKIADWLVYITKE